MSPFKRSDLGIQISIEADQHVSAHVGGKIYMDRVMVHNFTKTRKKDTRIHVIPISFGIVVYFHFYWFLLFTHIVPPFADKNLICSMAFGTVS